ncbi:MAG: hypothetical protein M3380_07940, partial [Chloroflexota bacterium]|nr:hypothetical protein [Chloroflexota bacterium]
MGGFATHTLRVVASVVSLPNPALWARIIASARLGGHGVGSQEPQARGARDHGRSGGTDHGAPQVVVHQGQGRHP